MNQRDVVLGLLGDGRPMPYIPAAFFIHFPAEFHAGQAAVAKHLEYYRFTGMDMAKIQYEKTFPRIPEIRRPEDWAKMPFYGREFYEDPLAIVAQIVKAKKSEAVVLQTIYSPFMNAAETVGDELVLSHMRQDPEKVKRGLDVITESTLFFVRECIKLGVDGFYHSTEGGEADRLEGPLFTEYVKPSDLIVMKELNDATPFNILHVCDLMGEYRDLATYLDYPGNVVNCPLKTEKQSLTPREASKLFGRPYMGGLWRKGAIAGGTPEQIKKEVEAVLQDAPDRFILGADCTVPGETRWENIRTAIEFAHNYRR